MSQYQPGILAAPVPLQARHLFFAIEAIDAVPAALDALVQLADSAVVVGLGEPLVKALGARVEGLRSFPPISGPGANNPATQQALWCWLHGEDRGELLLRSRAFEKALAPAFRLVQMTEGFRYKTGFDLTDYEDGTENPPRRRRSRSRRRRQRRQLCRDPAMAARPGWFRRLAGPGARPHHRASPWR
ncbi:Dyp-type peroxidase [Pseudomonas hygromyciniae]|uniref:Dyp-type peroxidase n=1 Tax=Pseudomonas hygromyciniae TaxID=2812000 RepID=UPI0035C993E4